jgi:hypothetical protein
MKTVDDSMEMQIAKAWQAEQAEPAQFERNHWAIHMDTTRCAVCARVQRWKTAEAAREQGK